MDSAIVLAQPTEKEIIAQLTNEGTKAIRFTKDTGTAQWNAVVKNWEYVRGVEVVRESGYPGADLLVTGDVVYQYTAVDTYSYWKFRVIDNRYEGIPDPGADELQAIISKDWQKFYGYYFSVIIKVVEVPVLAEEPRFTWHNPNSVECRMKVVFEHIVSNTETETLECIWNLRLYRENPSTAWNNWFAIRSEEAADIRSIAKQQYTPEEIAALRKQTLALQ